MMTLYSVLSTHHTTNKKIAMQQSDCVGGGKLWRTMALLLPVYFGVPPFVWFSAAFMNSLTILQSSIVWCSYLSILLPFHSFINRFIATLPFTKCVLFGKYISATIRLMQMLLFIPPSWLIGYSTHSPSVVYPDDLFPLYIAASLC